LTQPNKEGGAETEEGGRRGRTGSDVDTKIHEIEEDETSSLTGIRSAHGVVDSSGRRSTRWSLEGNEERSCWSIEGIDEP
jgi:hypothetical protein